MSETVKLLLDPDSPHPHVLINGHFRIEEVNEPALSEFGLTMDDLCASEGFAHRISKFTGAREAISMAKELKIILKDAQRGNTHPSKNYRIMIGEQSKTIQFRPQKRQDGTVLASITETTAQYIDPLSGLYNRRGADQFGEEEYNKSIQRQQPSSFCIIDADHFKSINDNEALGGHAAGDTIIKGFGERIRSITRGTDIPSRYGGDEFSIFLPGITKAKDYASTMQSTMDKIASIHTNIRSQPFNHAGNPIWSTSSIGAVFSVPEAMKNESYATIVLRADVCLYVIKHNFIHRDCIAFWMPTAIDSADIRVYHPDNSGEYIPQGKAIAQFDPNSPEKILVSDFIYTD